MYMPTSVSEGTDPSFIKWTTRLQATLKTSSPNRVPSTSTPKPTCTVQTSPSDVCAPGKNHFSATRAGTPPSFRMANWCRMTEQCDITFNMMRPCTINPSVVGTLYLLPDPSGGRVLSKSKCIYCLDYIHKVSSNLAHFTGSTYS